MAKTKAAPVAAAPEPTPTIDPANPHDMQPADEPVSLDEVRVAPPEPSPEEPRRSPRDTAMAEIVAARHREIDRQNEYARSAGLGAAPEPPLTAINGQQDPSSASGAPQEPSSAINGQPEPQAQESSPAPAPLETAPSEPQRVHKLTVNNRQIEMPEADVIRAAEQAVYAHAALAEARRLHEEAQRFRAQPDSSARPSPPAASAPDSQSAPPGLDRDALLEFARSVLYGDEVKVADATRNLISQVQPQQSVDPTAIGQQAYERAAMQLRLERDIETFASEYQDIANDGYLAAMAGQRAQELRNHYVSTGSPKPELNIMREAGDWARDKVKAWSGVYAQPEPPPAPLPNAAPVDSPRTVIKRNTPNAPAAAGASLVQPVPRVKTGTDIVNQMRQARGQPVFTQ